MVAAPEAGVWRVSDIRVGPTTGAHGGVFAFGDATSQGSLPALGVTVNNVVGAVPTG